MESVTVTGFRPTPTADLSPDIETVVVTGFRPPNTSFGNGYIQIAAGTPWPRKATTCFAMDQMCRTNAMLGGTRNLTGKMWDCEEAMNLCLRHVDEATPGSNGIRIIVYPDGARVYVNDKGEVVRMTPGRPF